MKSQFFFEGRTERLIAVGRLVLASFSLLAIWLDPSTPAKHVAITYGTLSAYVVYALIMTVVVWGSYGPFVEFRLVTHVLDLAIFSIFMYLTEGPTSPFFVYFIFSILAATLRWQWRGTLWTAAAALTAFIGMGIYATVVLENPAFELNRFIIRSVYLTVVAALLGYMAVHESQRRSQLFKLAAWPRDPLLDVEKVASQVLEQAGSILRAPRVLMAWEESEEPWLYLGMFSNGRLHWSRKPPGSFGPLVDPSLEDRSFFSQDVGSSAAVVLDPSSSELRRWQGMPLNREVREVFQIQSALSVRLSGENLTGRLFFLDRSSLTSDDLVLAEVVGGQVAVSMDLYYFLQRLQRVTALGERVRLARDLHDGILQSLAATGLQLQAILEAPQSDSEESRKRLQTVQDLIVQEQRDLRSFIEQSKLATIVSSEMDFKLGPLLEQLGKTTERQWSLSINIKLDDSESKVPATLAREIYHIVREGLVNAARHAQASAASVELGIEDREVRINVSDNGRGFPFKGFYDQATLTKTGMGPAMLQSRIASLKGSLGIHSSESGARLDIRLPITQAGA